MTKQTPLIAAAVVAIVVGVWWLTRHDGFGDSVSAIQEGDSPGNSTVTPGRDPTTRTAVEKPSASLARAPASVSSSTETKVALPIQVTPGFEYLAPKSPLEDTDPRFVTVRRHQQLESEPRDPTWSDRTETALRAAIESELTAKGLDTHRIETPVIECRTNSCEIQAYGYTNDQMDFTEFQQLVFRALSSSVKEELDWDTQILNVGMDSPGLAGSRATLLAQLPRKKH